MPRKSDSAREEEPDTDEGASASEWAVWIATGVLCAGAYARHGLVVALLYWLSTAALCALDPSLHSLQLLNLAAVVYDLSFELHRLYILVSNRPLLMVVILGVALAVEWLLERYEEEDAWGADRVRFGAMSGARRRAGHHSPRALPARGAAQSQAIKSKISRSRRHQPSRFARDSDSDSDLVRACSLCM